jgi:FkbM family methyltransferase
MKRPIKGWIRRVALYERLRASFLAELYWSMSASQVIALRRAELEFYRTLLVGFKTGDWIFDIGANDGTKTDVFLRLGARVVAVDPDELNVRTMRRRFLTLRVPRKPVTIVPAAVSDRLGHASMQINAPGSAQNTLSDKWVSVLKNDDGRFGERFEFTNRREVPTVTLEQLIEQFGVPYFIKIDVEGFEPNVLKGLRRAVPFVSFEVNLPEFRPEGTECVKLLQSLAPEGQFNFSTGNGQGLALDRWVNADAFVTVLDRCADQSIDVFWRTS